MSARRPEAPRTERMLPGVWRLRLPLPWPGRPARQRLGGRRRRRHRPLRHRDGRQGPAAPARPRARPGRLRGRGRAAARLHPLPHRPLRARRRRSSSAPAASSGCTRPGSTSGCSPTTPRRRSSSGSRSRARAASRRRRWSATASRAATTTRPGSTRSSSPTASCVPGVEVETDLGTWQVYETPGHAPSHVVLHQPERRLMISGDHLLGRTVLFFDYGHSPDPVGEFLASLDEVEPLDVDLCLPGHGRPFRDPEAKIAEARAPGRRAAGQGARRARRGREQTAFEIVAEIVGPENVNTPASAWVLQIVLSCLDHLAILGEVEPVEGTDPQRWRASPVASAAHGQLHVRRARSRPRRRSSSRCSPTTAATPTSRRCAGPSSSARASRRRTGSARSACSRAVGPPLREEVIAYEAAEPLLLQGALRACRCATTSARSS